MIQTLQIAQLVLFIIPGLVLIAMGVVILAKPVSVIDRRWYWAVFLPILLANPLALVENSPIWPGIGPINWRVGLILAADLLMMIWVILTFRGYMVFGVDARKTQDVFIEKLQLMGFDVDVRTGEKRLLLGRAWEASILDISRSGQPVEIWITERFNEVVIRSDSAAGRALLISALPALGRVDTSYDYKDHAMGILFIVLGVVFAVLSWIFFFEPRLILLE